MIKVFYDLLLKNCYPKVIKQISNFNLDYNNYM